MDKAPAYDYDPTAEQLASLSTITANKRCMPLIHTVNCEIASGASLGLGYINAKKTLAKIKKYSLQEQDIFLQIITDNLSQRGITVAYIKKSKLYIIWNLSIWNMFTKYRNLQSTSTFTVRLHKKNGKFGIRITTKGQYRYVSFSDCALQIGDIILEVNGIDVTHIPHDSLVTLLSECVGATTFKISRTHLC